MIGSTWKLAMSAYSKSEILIKSDNPFVEESVLSDNLERLGFINYEIKKGRHTTTISGQCLWSLNINTVAKQLAIKGVNVIAKDSEEQLGFSRLLIIRDGQVVVNKTDKFEGE